ncbi:MAG TPA: hypothetical protein VHN37_16275, partial [Actinomycetota bacterium]|nr:hypothetical protein [Actinomycetota bacterium]
MSRSACAALLATLVLAGGCSEPEPRAAPRSTPAPSPSPSIVINPPGVVVENIALGASGRRVRRAIRDLKAVDL